MENPYQSPATVVENDHALNGPLDERMLATRMSRLGAAMLDGLIMMVPIVLFFFLVAPSSFVQQAEAGTWLSKALSSLASIGIFLLINGYWLATKGQTVGKKLAGIKIVSTENTLVPFGSLIGRRYLLFWIASMIPYGNIIGLINVLFIFRKSRRCLHDDLAGTMVVQA